MSFHLSDWPRPSDTYPHSQAGQEERVLAHGLLCGRWVPPAHLHTVADSPQRRLDAGQPKPTNGDSRCFSNTMRRFLESKHTRHREGGESNRNGEAITERSKDERESKRSCVMKRLESREEN